MKEKSREKEYIVKVKKQKHWKERMKIKGKRKYGESKKKKIWEERKKERKKD